MAHVPTTTLGAFAIAAEDIMARRTQRLHEGFGIEALKSAPHKVPKASATIDWANVTVEVIDYDMALKGNRLHTESLAWGDEF